MTIRYPSGLLLHIAKGILPLTAVFLTLAAVASAATSGWTTGQAAAKVKAVYRTDDPYPNAPDAVVAKATCTGVGKAVGRRYSRFHCSAVMRGWGEYSAGFHAVKKVTVRVSSAGHWSLREGWN